jgi:peptidoglycan/xylan/chitin deacetylase (PgdA/CDA1 family)
MKVSRILTGICSLALLAACNSSNDKAAKADSSTAVTAAAKPTYGAPIKYEAGKRYVFLTWDDSPQPPGTLNCRKIFQEEGIKATFFAVGFNQVGPQKRRLIDSIRANYPQFLLANHSFSHGFRDQYAKFYSHPMLDSATNDFLKNQELLQIPVKIIRLPGNNTWAFNGKIEGQKAENPLIKRLDSLGFKIIGWDLEWRQAKGGKFPQESATEMINKINQKFDDEATTAPNAIVILSHDRLFEKPQYVDSLRKFISTLKQDPKYVFETIDHYPMIQNK